MNNLIILFYLVLIVAPISTVLHELGHVLGAKSVNADKVTLRIGRGKPLITQNRGRIRLIINRHFFIGGLTESEREPPYSRKEKMWITFLGPAVNGIFAVISFLFLYIYPNKYLTLFLLFNVWMAVGNFLPFRIGEGRTDGYTILQLLKRQ